MIILLKKFFRSAIIYNMKFKGAIFDLDGTLLDSMHVWDKVDEEYFALLGKPVPVGYVLAIRDLTMLQAAEYTKRITGVADSAEEICAKWREMVADHYAEQVQPKRGAGFLQPKCGVGFLSCPGAGFRDRMDLGRGQRMPAALKG